MYNYSEFQGVWALSEDLIHHKEYLYDSAIHVPALVIDVNDWRHFGHSLVINCSIRRLSQLARIQY